MYKPKMFCLPFAGGNKNSYRGMISEESSKFQLHNIELMGRGSKINTGLTTDIDVMLDNIFSEIEPTLEAPYFIYGHSMGGLLAYLLSKKIVEKGYEPPRHVFISGCKAPSMLKGHAKYNSLTEDEILEDIKELGGMPQEILQNEKMMAYFLPIILADLRMIGRYNHDTDEKLNIPISLFFGHEESFTQEEIAAWRDVTSWPVTIDYYSGGHFFIKEHINDMMDAMYRKLFY